MDQYRYSLRIVLLLYVSVPLSLLYDEYRVSRLGVKRPGRDFNPPPQSNAEIKERVELYLYSPSEPLWRVLRRTLLFVATHHVQ